MSGTPAERKEAEDQLTAILNRAMKHVPLVKLDAVEDVIKLFTEAIDMMEANQIVDEDDRPMHSQPHPSSAGLNTQQLHDANRQSHLISLAGNASTATTASNSGASSTNSSDSESSDHRPLSGGGGGLVNKTIAGIASAALTVDYSSPSSKTRSLGGKAPPKEVAAAPPAAARLPGSTGLGLGLGNKSAPAAPKQVGVLGLHGGHKPSSRATTGLNALNAAAAAPATNSPVSPTTPDSSSSTSEDGETSGALPNGGVLKNKFVSKAVANGPTSREYPSPRLGPRSLERDSITPKSLSPAPSNAGASGDQFSLPMPDTLGRDSHPASSLHDGISPDADDEDEGGAEDGDLIPSDKKNSVFNRIKNTLPVTASPKQIRSSLHLLDLAKTNSLANEGEEDLTLKTHSSSATPPPPNTTSPPNATNGVIPASIERAGTLSALPTGLQTSSTNSTPKPAYLRRLDSPDTHHGQLLAAKARLQLLLNKGIQLADRVDLTAVPQIKAKLEQALAKLEASIVQTTLGQ